MCVRAGTSPAELRRSVESTARSLRKGDAFFIHVDGDTSLPGVNGELLASPASWEICFSSKRIGLAAGLNRLIETVLCEGCYEFRARMDADDESVPDRFKNQLAFLECNPVVDILGGLCNEIDETGKHLRCKKLPIAHEEIIESLPKRNPLNHPTVVLRQHVFEKGIRYRTDVGLVEDWHLWVDAATLGFKFANLNKVVLNFSRSRDFFKKRGGWKQSLAEWRIRKYARKQLKASGLPNFCYALGVSALRLCPSYIQKTTYEIVG